MTAKPPFDPPRLAVFCGSSAGNDSIYAEATDMFARTLVAARLGLVYGGGGTGLMGNLADSVLAAGGEVIGIIPEALATRELAHHGLTRLDIVDSMHERKSRMAELAGGFVALPGGLGTLEELCEILTWAQLGIHDKPVGMLDVGGYFVHLRALLDNGVAQGFIRPEHRRLVVHSDDPSQLIEKMAAQPRRGVEPRWLNLSRADG